MLKVQGTRLIPLSGSEAVAKAVVQAGVEFASAYPITPQTIIVERLSDLVAAGETKMCFLNVESEHSALSACVGASLAGARTFTATSSQGLALMHEVLYLASGLRCPIVMAVANRALSAPINIHGDHSDMMGSRDSGWVQLYVENAQEAYDWIFQSYKLAEDERVSLPFTINMDGYVITHSVEPIATLDDETIIRFLSKRRASLKMDTRSPMTFGPLALPDYYSEFKRQQEEAMRAVPEVLGEITKEFGELSGRGYAPVVPYALKGAKVVFVSLGSVSGTVRWVARELRKKGLPVGALRIELYRPFPHDQVADLLQGAESVVVLDRALSSGAQYGPLANDVIGSLYDRPEKPVVLDIIAGLGGRDLSPQEIEKIFLAGMQADKKAGARRLEFVGVRE